MVVLDEAGADTNDADDANTRESLLIVEVSCLESRNAMMT